MTVKESGFEKKKAHLEAMTNLDSYAAENLRDDIRSTLNEN